MLTASGRLIVTAGFGVAAMGPQGDATTATAAALLGRADAALYRSKNAGRNCVTSAAHVGQWSSEWMIQPTRLKAFNTHNPLVAVQHPAVSLIALRYGALW